MTRRATDAAYTWGGAILGSLAILAGFAIAIWLSPYFFAALKAVHIP